MGIPLREGNQIYKKEGKTMKRRIFSVLLSLIFIGSFVSLNYAQQPAPEKV